jgi:GGDEF domain-containing protein
MLLEVDNLESIGQLLGPDGRDLMLRRAAILVRCTVRPTDLVARTGEAEFAIWFSGADLMTAAERAEDLCLVQRFHRSTPIMPPCRSYRSRSERLDHG